jgi:hypothetical protein
LAKALNTPLSQLFHDLEIEWPENFLPILRYF